MTSVRPESPCEDCRKASTQCCHESKCELLREYEAQIYIYEELTKEFRLKLRRREEL